MMTAKAQANLVMENRERLIRRAVDFAMGRSDWTLEEVKDRGELIHFGPNECVFMFDGRPMVEVYVTTTVVHDETIMLLSTTEYKELYDDQTR